MSQTTTATTAEFQVAEGEPAAPAEGHAAEGTTAGTEAHGGEHGGGYSRRWTRRLIRPSCSG